MKRALAVILTVIMLFSVLCMPASALSFTKKADTPYHLDLVTGTYKWLYHSFSSENYNESNIQFTMKKEAASLLFKSAPFAHASTILKMPNGSLICAWFGGKEEGDMGTRIWYSIKAPGGKWCTPRQIMDGIAYAHWNPVLYLTEEGNVRLYYKSNGDPQSWHGYYCESADCGQTWSEVKEIPFESDTGLVAGGPVKNKCLKTSGGLLLAPNSYETDETWRVVIQYSRDDGRTWQDNGEVVAYNDYGKAVKIIQPTLWESDDGSVHALLRSNDHFIYRTDSYDGGMTWCTAYRTSLPNTTSGIDLVKSDDGLIWLVCNPALMWVRSPLTLYVSEDDSSSWKPVLDAEKLFFLEYSYPSIIADGTTLYISYTNVRMGINVLTIDYQRS